MDPVRNILGVTEGECEDCKYFDEYAGMYVNVCKRSSQGCKFIRKR